MEVRTLILGAGAAGLFCAAHAGPGTLVVDHARRPGEKIRISGGGRCNFTNTGTVPERFLSENPHFAKSALARYGPWDFVDLVGRHGIAWHEKTLGQLFCDGSAKQIVAMLLDEAARAGATVETGTEVGEIAHDGSAFRVVLEREGRRREVAARHLVVATGGKSIPKMGATGRAYEIATQFGLGLTETRAALVPFTFPEGRFAPLSGTALPVRAAAGGAVFEEAMLFTHRGLSGPAMLQCSSYWREGEDLTVDLLPGRDAAEEIAEAKRTQGARRLSTWLSAALPTRLAESLASELPAERKLAELSTQAIRETADRLHGWTLRPGGTEGYRTAEVTLGGVATGGLSSKTMEAKTLPGLFFIGEAVDVTGWLGGYNFQWAWASAHAAGTEIASRG
ncbi:BaiN/RdsA family NAD(P)/FAD-dependent oxidoreductase [Histidinibacterium aquaticum]|uniref:NAD(P)/FAD-dependent oxidoreductase n=1 Tax=Histidinibacterium aquaticum TaxID=2613962 RepID=A0A5J5GJK8_9RHOB|nr:NAD(P)/FAD-dependent oxidoreductase [Histidinibacterium aquaticum]KAA9007933.1 NAD(P)/FAD-dependent oxidoreductase [Histidinibacterium aquaticum]